MWRRAGGSCAPPPVSAILVLPPHKIKAQFTLGFFYIIMGVTMKGFVFGLALALVSGVSMAAEWVIASATDGGMFFWIDRESVVKIGTSRIAWVWSISLDKPVGKTNAWSGLGRNRFDCDMRTYQLLSMNVYDKAGTILEEDNTPGRVTAIVPDSSYERVFSIVCSDSRLAALNGVRDENMRELSMDVRNKLRKAGKIM